MCTFTRQTRQSPHRPFSGRPPLTYRVSPTNPPPHPISRRPAQTYLRATPRFFGAQREKLHPNIYFASPPALPKPFLSRAQTLILTSTNLFYHERKPLSSRAQTLRAHPARLRTNAKYAENKLCIENVNNIRTQQSLDRKLPPTHQPSKNRKRLFCLLTSR